MRRKQTQLEKNLNELGYKLSHKTYCGKKSEKVDEYIFLKQNGFTLYFVAIDRVREHINSYAFSNKSYSMFNDCTIEELKEINDKLHEEMKEIYDFENKVAKEYVPFNLGDIEEAFIEESNFDEEN